MEGAMSGMGADEGARRGRTGFAGTRADVRVHVAGTCVLLVDAARGLVRSDAHVARDPNAELGGAARVVDEAYAAVTIAHGGGFHACSVLRERWW